MSILTELFLKKLRITFNCVFFCDLCADQDYFIHLYFYVNVVQQI